MQNTILRTANHDAIDKLEPYLTIVECRKGEVLLHQGVHEMEQYFILDGILKRMVTNQQAKEMILRFAAADKLLANTVIENYRVELL